MILLFSSCLLVFVFDRISKTAVLEYLKPGESIPVINNVFHLTLVHNTGAAFGVFRHHPQILTAVTVILSVAIIAFLATRHRRLFPAEKLALSFILSGAAGNLFDRFSMGYVVDFLDFRIWPVFNVADSFITMGVGLLAISVFFRGKKRQESQDA